MRWIIVWTGLLLFGLAPGVARASVSLTQISLDPFTNSTSQHATQVEPDAFAVGSTIVAAFQSGRFFGGGASDVGWATSTNAGATWSDGFLPNTVFAGGVFDRATDPVVAYDARHGVWLVASLGFHASTGSWDVVVNRSADGLSWGARITVTPGPVHGSLDKPWITCDSTSSSPFYGHCYLQWTDFQGSCSQHVQLSTSTDGGVTWGPIETPASNTSATASEPVVQPGGTVIDPIAGGCQQDSLRVLRSIDGGASWSAAARVAAIKAHAMAGGLRPGATGLPSTAVDASGRVYVAWWDCRFRAGCRSNDIVFSTSPDGVSWSPVTRVPIDSVNSGADHFLPGLAVDRSTSGGSAHVGVTYYYYPQASCTFSTCELDVGFVSSGNGGAAWSAPTQLAGPMSLSWLAQTGGGPMVGDYIATVFTSDGLAHPLIEVAHAPTGSLLDEATYTSSTGLTATAGTAVASAGGVAFIGGTQLSAPPRH